MLSLICQTFPNLSISARSSLVAFNSHGTKSAVESSKQSKKESFSASYLVNNCGFSSKKALSASKYLKFETPDKPDSVLSFLRHHGFTESQVSNVVKENPIVLLCDPENTLLPKIEFFESIGFTVEDFTCVLSAAPGVFTMCLKNQILPIVNFLKMRLLSPVKVIVCVKRFPWILVRSSLALMEDNIEILREMGVGEAMIGYCVYYYPRLLNKDKDKSRMVVEEVKGLGFDPSKRRFLDAIHVFFSMNKLTWENKICVYKKWGLSEDEILDAFRKFPWVMARSEDKILGVMDFLVNKMGFESSVVLKYPSILGYSLEKRIVPRCMVCQALWSKGLLVKDINLVYRAVKVSEEMFRKNYVESYSEDVPELLTLYLSS